MCHSEPKAKNLITQVDSSVVALLQNDISRWIASSGYTLLSESIWKVSSGGMVKVAKVSHSAPFLRSTRLLNASPAITQSMRTASSRELIVQSSAFLTIWLILEVLEPSLN